MPNNVYIPALEIDIAPTPAPAQAVALAPPSRVRSYSHSVIFDLSLADHLVKNSTTTKQVFLFNYQVGILLLKNYKGFCAGQSVALRNLFSSTLFKIGHGATPARGSRHPDAKLCNCSCSSVAKSLKGPVVFRWKSVQHEQLAQQLASIQLSTDYGNAHDNSSFCSKLLKKDW